MPKNFTSTVAGAAILITGVGLLSKGFGFLREIIFAKNFGLQLNYDLYLVGAVLPITLNTSIFYLAQNYFIPTYHKKLSMGPETAERFFISMFWFFIINSLLVTLILLITSPLLFTLYLGVNDSVILNLILKIFKIFLLTISFNAGFSIIAAYFQAEYNFKAPAFASLFQNIVIILLVLIFSDSLDVIAIAIGYLCGTAAQFFYLFLLLKIPKRKFFARKNLGFNEIGIFNKSLVVIIAIEVINQLYILVDRYFYGSVDVGGIAAINFAAVLFSLPISILSLALATAIFPKLSSAFSTMNNDVVKEQYLSGLQLNIFLFIPICFVFILFGDSIIRIFYQRGNFTSEDTFKTFEILKLYSLSLLFYSSYAVINKVIYGARIIKGLLLISIVVFLLKIILNYLLVAQFKQNGLAVSTSICYISLSLGCYILTVRKLKLNNTIEVVTCVLFYSLNGIFSYIVTIIIKEHSIIPPLINDFLMILIFGGIYIMNVELMKSKEYIILKNSLKSYF